MNTDEKAMLESATALVWEHQRDMHDLFEKVKQTEACVQAIISTTSSSTEIEEIWRELIELKNSLSSLSCQVDSLAVKELL